MPSWLKRAGEIALRVAIGWPQGAAVIKAVAPDAIDRVVDRLSNYVDPFTRVIINAEIMGQAFNTPGPDKLKAATPAMVQVILNSDFMIGKKIDNPALFEQGAMKIADGWADVLNSLKEEDKES